MKRGRRTVVLLVLAALLTGCSQALPESVVPGTKIVMGWAGEFTSTNTAVSPTAGNLDVAAMTRSGFGDVVDGTFVPDEGFGTVKILEEDPFTVRYDLAEPLWSDGVPLDAADLMMGWAASAGYFNEGGAPDGGGDVPRIDEFARSIDVTWEHPRDDWQTVVAVPVPAHVLAGRALGIEDAMEAKLALITAIRTGDDAALQKVARVWREGFTPDAEGAMLSSGPFVVEEVADGGRGVVLTPNTFYKGLRTPQVAQIELVAQGDNPVAAVGAELDIVQVAPVLMNQDLIRDLELKDFGVNTSSDGTVWAMLLNPVGVLSTTSARTAFLHAVPASELLEGGGDRWRTAYAPTTSMTTSSESSAYELVNEESGFTEILGSTDGEPELEREAAGLGAGTTICVLYDRASEFATGAFEAMSEVVGEAGWRISDCSADDFSAALEKRNWNAVITRVPIAETAADIAAQWGSESTGSITRSVDPVRDELIAELAEETDVYKARDLLAQIEASIVDAAIALPIAANPRVTINARDVEGVAPRNGAVASVTSGAVLWSTVP